MPSLILCTANLAGVNIATLKMSIMKGLSKTENRNMAVIVP